MNEVQSYLSGARILRNHKQYVHFSGTNYLGTATDARLNTYFAEGVSRYGSYVSTSRASNISFDIFSEADRYIAKWIGTEAGLVFSSGFAACQTILKVFADEKIELCYAPGVHPANWRSEADETKEELRTWTDKFVTNYQKQLRPLALFYKPVDPLNLQPISMQWLQEIPKENDLLLILDDSHILGLWGEKGGGIHQLLRESSDYDHISCLVAGSLSKGLGLPAGYLAAQKKWVELIIRSPFYLGGSMPSAAAMYVFLRAEADYARLRKKLQANIERFCQQMSKEGLLKYFRYLPHYPIFLYQAANLYTYLLKRGLCIAHFSYPRPKDKPQTRIVIQGAHSSEDIDTLVQEIAGFFKSAR